MATSDSNVVIPRAVLAELLFTLGQARTRLQTVVRYPGAVDRQIIENAGRVLTHAKAALEMSPQHWS